MYYQILVSLEGEEKRWALQMGENRVGSGPATDIRLEHEGVDREHALLMVEDQGVWIQDVDSKGKTYVNGEPVGASVWLQPGDRIDFGPKLQAVLEGAAEPKAPANQPPDQAEPATRPEASAPSASAAVKPKRGRSCFTTLLVGALVVAALVVAGYYLFTSGVINQRELLNSVGLGTGEISIANTTETDLTATLTQLEGTESGGPETHGTMQANALEINTFTELAPGPYELTFSSAAYQALNQTCGLLIASGEVYQFVLIPEGIAVTEERFAPTGPDEVNALTSPLCNR